eukprot:6247020-Amphidinium_carterae.2
MRLRLQLNRNRCTVLVQEGDVLHARMVEALEGTDFAVVRAATVLGVGLAAGLRRGLGKRKV